MRRVSLVQAKLDFENLYVVFEIFRKYDLAILAETFKSISLRLATATRVKMFQLLL